MELKAQSIDGAAGGLVRHRFVRALGASLVVLVVFGLLGLTLGACFHVIAEKPESFWAAPIAAPIILFVFLTPVILAVGATGALLDLMPRRLIALINLVVFALIALLGPVFVGIYAAQLLGLIHIERSTIGATPLQDAVLLIFLALASLVAFEWTGQAWWQLTTSRDGFRAARGWRPPLSRLLSTFRRHIGLPAFIANVGKGRFVVTLLYFTVAVFNCGLVALFFSVFFIAGQQSSTPESDLIVVLAVLAALVLTNLFGAGRFFQRLAASRATKIYQHVREWDQRAPVVFLRAFDQDKAKIKVASRDPFVRMAAGVAQARTLDELILEHASPYGPVIAIGDPRDPTPPLGAARIFVKDQGAGWQSVVGELVAAANTVVMCPNSSAGVHWEIELLDRSGVKPRTIFLANPETPEEEVAALFAKLAPEQSLTLKRGQFPIAAFTDPQRGWRVLSARRRSVQTYTIALNIALQAMFGLKGAPMQKGR